MQIVYLDQNKWIELARAATHPTKYPDLRDLLDIASQEVSAGRLALPLTAANIYETHKINNAQRRHELAFVQAFLSRGLVFHGRHKRLEAEVTDVLRSAYGLPNAVRDQNWFLSNVFFEAFAEWGDKRVGFPIPERLVNLIRKRPADCLYDYLLTQRDDIRIAATRNFSEGSEQLRQRIEERRLRHRSESLSLRRRIHSAILLINEIDLVLEFARKAGIPWNTAADIGSANARSLVRDVPAYYVEREIALRLEAQNRPIHENDFRDMQSFCTVIPYADVVVGENQFVSLAHQAKLGEKYGTHT